MSTDLTQSSSAAGRPRPTLGAREAVAIVVGIVIGVCGVALLLLTVRGSDSRAASSTLGRAAR
jgi:hypothetical protein